MENERIGIIVFVVLVAFFAVAYLTMSKPKTSSIVVAAPGKVYSLPITQRPMSEFVVDMTKHFILPAPQSSGNLIGPPKENFDILPAPGNLIGPAKENVDRIQEQQNQLPKTKIPDLIDNNFATSKVNPSVAKLLLQKQIV